MVTSLRKRFNGNGEEVVNYAKIYGRWKAMTEYGVKDVVAFQNYLEEVTGDANFGIEPVFSVSDGDGVCGAKIFEEFLDAIIAKIRKMDADYATQMEKANLEIKRLGTQLEYYKGSQHSREITLKMATVMAEVSR